MSGIPSKGRVYLFSRTSTIHYHSVVICPFNVLEAQSLRSRCWGSWFHLKAVGKTPFSAHLLAPEGFVVPWFIDSQLQSLPVSSIVSASVHLCVFCH